MNICFCGNFTSGGTERAAFLVANELCQEHKVFVLNTSNKTPTFYLRQAIKLDNLSSGSVPIRILYLKSYLNSNKIDILVAIEALTGLFSIIATKMAGCKHIVWEHANYYQNQGSRWTQIVRQIELLTADAYVVLTKQDKENFKSHFNVRTQLEQIYNIATRRSDPILYDLESKTIISAGHIRKIKNFIAIPEIGKLVFAKHPDWCWKIFGAAEGEEYERIQLKVKEYGLEQNILFCGRSDLIDKEYQSAAMYVMTSLHEGLPMVLLEAKSNGLPLISFDIQTGPAEIIRNGVNGYLIPPFEIETMAEKICNLIEDRELRKSFSIQSELDLDKFDKENIIEKWEKLINSILT